MTTKSLIKLSEEIPDFPTLRLIEEYKYSNSPQGKKEQEDMLGELKGLLSEAYLETMPTSEQAFQVPEPTALYYDHDLVLEQLDLSSISENSMVVNGNLSVDHLIIDAEIDINTSLVVMGNLEAENFICSGSDIYVAKTIHVANSFIAHYNHGRIRAQKLFAHLLLTHDYWGFEIPEYKANKNCHWQDQKAFPYSEVIQPELIESMTDNEGKVQQWPNFEKICNYIEADKGILR
ncbi:hypothetical protein [Pseudozobellia thermophila]|uniref:Protein CcmA, bactofilin family n=1 Tax=Pseudozobellia thermophila TaxID=192903 RepID=A0A1M6EKY4_9FLAO|nr:hypothetical protein [Pseudozobellia thermophila]SHI86172.1 hypothetical protein SAMN04488513_10295 [Pseudozobellia thermophila]